LSVTVRQADVADVAWMTDLAAGEGWNPGLHDAECFYAADPGGFFVAEEDGRRVGSISCVHYGASYAFFGFYLVVPDRRGQGIGGPLFAAMLERGAGRTIGLDGVLAQQDRYAEAGFVLEHRTLRYELPATGGPRRPSAAPDFAAHDRRAFPAPRDAFLRAWTTTPGHYVHASDAGYGVLRSCRTGSKIGPLFAEDRAAAEDLLDALLAAAPPGPVYLDAPEHNAALAADRGGVPVFESVRMYRGAPPAFDRSRVFGTTTLELG
jgi:GNAT superfamily N-acetyltransferase